MTTLLPFIIILFLSLPVFSQDSKVPIIDMHMHCYDSTNYFNAPDWDGKMSAENQDEHLKQCYAIMKKYNIVKGVISGHSLNAAEKWAASDPDNRFIKGIVVENPKEIDINNFENLIKEGKIEVFGEIGAIYAGYTLNDPEFEPFLKICEEYDVPVAIHTGGGPPGVTYDERYTNFRLVLGDPLLIEDVLVKFPKLRIYMMHAGEVFYEHAVSLMFLYPQLYTDLGVLLWVTPLVKSYAVDFLKRAKDADILDRVMFGSDQMVWPHAIEMSIEYLNSMDFLTDKEKRDIFYNNAARFLKLENKITDVN